MDKALEAAHLYREALRLILRGKMPANPKATDAIARGDTLLSEAETSKPLLDKADEM